MIVLIQIEPFQILETFYRGVPEPVVWPDGSLSHGIEAGFVRDNYALVNAVTEPPPPNDFYYEAGRTPRFENNTVIYTIDWKPDLEQAKASTAQRVDMTSESLRLQYITQGNAQALVYLAKELEAQAYAANPGGSFPLLEASVGIEGDTVGAVADFVAKTAGQWKAIAATIERLRLGAKSKIKAATTVEEVLAVFQAISWPGG